MVNNVPFFDKQGNRYDLKGKMIPKGKPVTPKARKKYVPHRHSAPRESPTPGSDLTWPT